MIVVLNAGAAAAQTQPNASRQAAYEAAMKCFVANGRASGLNERAGDTANVARYEAMSRRSFDTAVHLGEALGYSGGRINQDFGITQSRELPRMVQDRQYFEAAVAFCRALELM